MTHPPLSDPPSSDLVKKGLKGLQSNLAVLSAVPNPWWPKKLIHDADEHRIKTWMEMR